MTQAEAVADIGLASKLLEQLGEAVDQLESNKDAFSKLATIYGEVKEHMQNLETSFRKRIQELEEREKDFEEKASSTQRLIDERETEVAGKERASLDHIQQLKDAAVDAIAEARKKYKPVSPLPDDIKVSPSPNGDLEPSFLPREEESKSPDARSGGGFESTGPAVKLHPKLKHLCDQMDAKGLLRFLGENKKMLTTLCGQVPVALKNADDLARLVLDSSEVFNPPDQKDAAAYDALRRTCLSLMEAAALSLGGEQPLSSEMTEKVKSIAREWHSKLEAAETDAAANGSSMEAQALLHLLTTFNIAREFEEDELCKLILAVCGRRQEAELCRSLGLDHKVPGIIEVLISGRRHIDAVHLVYAFHLTGSFPPVRLLREYLATEKTAQDPSSATQDAEAQELSTLRAVIKCIEEYSLQSEYPLAPLQRRVAELKKAKAENGSTGPSRFRSKRPRGGGYSPRFPAGDSRGGDRYFPRFSPGDPRSAGGYRPRFSAVDSRDGGGYPPRFPGMGVDQRQHEPPPAFDGGGGGFRGGSSERYHFSAPPSSYSYQMPNHHAPYEPTSYVPSVYGSASYDPEAKGPSQNYYPEEIAPPPSYASSNYASQGASGGSGFFGA